MKERFEECLSVPVVECIWERIGVFGGMPIVKEKIYGLVMIVRPDVRAGIFRRELDFIATIIPFVRTVLP